MPVIILHMLLMFFMLILDAYVLPMVLATSLGLWLLVLCILMALIMFFLPVFESSHFSMRETALSTRRKPLNHVVQDFIRSKPSVKQVNVYFCVDT